MKRHERAAVRIYTEEQKAAKKAYRAMRREHYKAYNARYNAERKENIALQRAAYRAANREEVALAKRRDYEANRDKRLSSIRAYYAKHADSIIERKRIRRQSEPLALAQHNSAGARRRAATVKATPKWADRDAIVAVYEAARRLSVEAGIPYHVDHDIPLLGKTVCGLHVHHNLRPIPAEVNLKKRNHLLTDEIV